MTGFCAKPFIWTAGDQSGTAKCVLDDGHEGSHKTLIRDHVSRFSDDGEMTR